MQVLCSLVVFGLIAAATADMKATFDNCCKKANMDEAGKTAMTNSLQNFDMGNLSPEAILAVTCCGEEMKVVDNGKVKAAMVAMAASSVMNSAQRTVMRKCMTAINEKTNKDATVKALQCATEAKQK